MQSPPVGPYCHAQVEDVYLMEEKAITQLSQEEVTDDPLVFLPCGHAFFMSAMVRAAF